jgi:integrin beta 3
MLIDRSGCCIATMTDGTVRDLGPVVGRDGAPGEPGKDGKDGITFDDFQPEVEYDGQRMVTFKIVSKGKSLEWPYKIPMVIDRGVYRPETLYEHGDAVSFGGSIWIAQRDAPEGKPDAGNGAWRLAVKHGRDGRDGKDGAKGERGLEGRPGRDLTLGSS